MQPQRRRPSLLSEFQPGNERYLGLGGTQLWQQVFALHWGVQQGSAQPALRNVGCCYRLYLS